MHTLIGILYIITTLVGIMLAVSQIGKPREPVTVAYVNCLVVSSAVWMVAWLYVLGWL